MRCLLVLGELTCTIGACTAEGLYTSGHALFAYIHLPTIYCMVSTLYTKRTYVRDGVTLHMLHSDASATHFGLHDVSTGRPHDRSPPQPLLGMCAHPNMDVWWQILYRLLYRAQQADFIQYIAGDFIRIRLHTAIKGLSQGLW